MTERTVTIRPAADDVMVCRLEGAAPHRITVDPDVA